MNYESIFRVVIGLVLVFFVNCCKIIYFDDMKVQFYEVHTNNVI